ncbi:MAG TPA: 1-acyl-sn-glycerol-3-phosphate acyltransferase [Anaeromyxobacteraceae bacterium]|nr:1-acyl-sn-glycerol-3-phosphate acyltransferase [Anaeromyxobacteraceae bacterium]
MSEEPTSQFAAGRPAARFSLVDRWFRPVQVPRDGGRELADLAGRGSLVFVMRSAGLLNFLYLAWLLRQLGLPPLRAALGLTGFLPWLARVRSGAEALTAAIEGGEAAVVFLQGTRGPDPFPLLVALQRRLGRPIHLVPALLVWTRRPQKLKPTLGEILFGTPDQPSRLANALGFALNRRRAVLRLGRASDLSSFVGERREESDAVLGRKLRGALHHHLAMAVEAVVGPPLKSAARVREQVLRDRSLRAALAAEAARTGRPVEAVAREAERDLAEIASRYAPALIELLRPVLSWIFRRLYDSVDVDEEGLARLKRAAGEAPLVLCPSHKSYVDFLVLSWALYMGGMTPPHVAAGINLSFWPFGAIARRGGAFFIRRTMKGNRIYTATLRAYVKELLRQRVSQEFYVEGGRSRSGKLLFPKTGLVSMEIDAWLEQAADDVLFVPVAIDYERLIEARSYAHELAGGEKSKEDIRGLLRARKVLRRRYGRLTVQFEQPISLRAFAAERLGSEGRSLTAVEAGVEPGAAAPSGPLAADQRRTLVQGLASRIAWGINQAATVTASGLLAAALLAHVRRGIGAEELTRRVALLRSLAARQGARFGRGLADAPPDPRRPGPLADAMARYEEEGLVRVERAAGEVIYQVVEERRPLLDYHKNAVLHRYVALSLVAGALRASGGEAPLPEVLERTQWLSRLFKLEFMYAVGTRIEDTFDAAVAELERAGAVARDGGRLLAGPDLQTLDFLADLLRPYLEAYLVAAETLVAPPRGEAPADRRALVKVALEQGRASYAAGRIALRESLSKATFENAAEWLAQQGAFAAAEQDAAAAHWRDAACPELVREIKRHLQV